MHTIKSNNSVNGGVGEWKRQETIMYVIKGGEWRSARDMRERVKKAHRVKPRRGNNSAANEARPKKYLFPLSTNSFPILCTRSSLPGLVRKYFAPKYGKRGGNKIDLMASQAMMKPEDGKRS